MNRNRRIISMAVLVLSLGFVGAARASDSNFRLGVQGAPFVAGLSGIIDISNPWAVQGVVDFGADAVAIRILNRFTQKRFWNAYGTGTVGLWRNDSYESWGLWKDNTPGDNDGLGLAVGIGIEYDWRGIDSSLPPIGWNIEVGASVVPGFYLDVGIGVHWMF